MNILLIAAIWTLFQTGPLTLFADDPRLEDSRQDTAIAEKIAALEQEIQQAQAERYRTKHRLEYENTNAIPLRIRAKEVEGELVKARQEYREQLRIREHAAAEPLFNEAHIADLQEQISRLEPAHREAVARLHALLDEQPEVKELDQRLQSLASERQTMLNQRNALITDEP